MKLYTVYNCDDQITGIYNYIPNDFPSECRLEPINLDIDYPKQKKVYMIFGTYHVLSMEKDIPVVSQLYRKYMFSSQFTDAAKQLIAWKEKFGINSFDIGGTGEYEVNKDYSTEPGVPMSINPLFLLIDDYLNQEENDASQHGTSTCTGRND